MEKEKKREKYKKVTSEMWTYQGGSWSPAQCTAAALSLLTLPINTSSNLAACFYGVSHPHP